MTADKLQEVISRDSIDPSSDSDTLWPTDFFQEPDSFRPSSPEPTTVKHVTASGRCLTIRLLGTHPLWGHVLYPASVVLSRYIEEHSSKLFPVNAYTQVLELGAGAGLPGLTSVLCGANLVATTDFPDPDLITNLKWNVDNNLPDSLRRRMIVKGLKWGSRLNDDIFDDICLNSNDNVTPKDSSATSSDHFFDLILLSDLVFNHSEHNSLLATCELSLRSTNLDTNRTLPSLLVFYSHHRPWCVEADLKFFIIARQRGWKCNQIIEDKTAGLAFPNDEGDPHIRGTVHGWILTR